MKFFLGGRFKCGLSFSFNLSIFLSYDLGELLAFGVLLAEDPTILIVVFLTPLLVSPNRSFLFLSSNVSLMKLLVFSILVPVLFVIPVVLRVEVSSTREIVVSSVFCFYPDGLVVLPSETLCYDDFVLDLGWTNEVDIYFRF